ncbi:MAG TPA: hypothetical protein ACFCUC_17780 [Desulfobacterales bacterium]
MDVLDILQEKLIGNFYSRFSVGDTWDFCFHDFWLISHNVISSHEAKLNAVLQNSFKPAIEAVDKEDVAKSIIVCSTQRKQIIDISLKKDSTLSLIFENEVELIFPTDTNIVDWHWAINKDGGDPYLGFIVGCFNPGKVEVDC